MHVAQRFEHFLDAYRRPNGSRSDGTEARRGDGRVVTRSYVTNLRKGRLENPGYEKMLAIARAMEFPPALWFDETPGEGTRPAPDEELDLAARVVRLFETIKIPKAGERYTDAQIARMAFGGLTKGDVEGIRTGRMPDPTVSQVAAIAAAFGVPPSYLVDQGKGQPVLRRRTPY